MVTMKSEAQCQERLAATLYLRPTVIRNADVKLDQ